MKSWFISLVTLAACGSDVQTGRYEITSATAQDTGSAAPNRVGEIFTVSKVEGGVLLDGFRLRFAEVLSPDGDDYRYEKYKTTQQTCEAGGTKRCFYEYLARTAHAPSAGTLHITECRYEKASDCGLAPQCSTAEKVLGESVPCRPPATIDAKRVGDVPLDAF